MPGPYAIVADALVKALVAREVIPPNCRRVVIDLPAGDVGYLWFECLTDERLLEVLQDPAVRISFRDAEQKQPEAT